MIALLAAQGAPMADFSQDTWWIWLIKAVAILLILVLSVIMALWVERRGLGRMQTRPGPNVLGPLGLFQAIADALKLVLKEDFWLKGADKIIYMLGPVIAATSAFMIFAVIPMGGQVSMFGVETPNFVELEVTKADPGVKGDTATNVTKPATVETGAEIKVPLFINEGEKIQIDTRTGEYLGRVKG